MALERQPQEGSPPIGCIRSAATLVATRKKSWRLDDTSWTVSATSSMLPQHTLSDPLGWCFQRVALDAAGLGPFQHELVNLHAAFSDIDALPEASWQLA